MLGTRVISVAAIGPTGGDQPVTGDWVGDGKTDIGIFGKSWSGDERALEHERGLPDVANSNWDPRFG